MKRFLVSCSLLLFLMFGVPASASNVNDAATGSSVLLQSADAISTSKDSIFRKIRNKFGRAAEPTVATSTPHLNIKSEIIKGTMKRLLPFAYRAASEGLAAASTILGYDPDAAEKAKASARTTPTIPVAVTSATPNLPLDAVRLSEAYPYPDSSEREWIELIDRSNVAALLDGWTIEDGKGVSTALSGTLLPWTRMFIASPKGQLNDGGDEIVLKDPDGRARDGVSYGDFVSDYPNVGTVRKGESLMRLEMKELFAVTMTPTPGGSNVLTKPATETVETHPPTAVTPSPEARSEQSAPHLPPATIPVDDQAAASGMTTGITPQKPVLKKTALRSRYAGNSFLAVVAAPPGVYSKSRMYVLIDDVLREVRLAKATSADLPAGRSISFVAQEKGDGALAYLLANPNSIRTLDSTSNAEFESVEAWPDVVGPYRFEAEVIARQDGILSVMLGGAEGDILAPAALSASLRTGDIVSIEGYVEPGERPRAVLAGVGSLTLFKSFQAAAALPKASPPARLPWPAVVGLTLFVVIIGAYAYLRTQRLQRLALVSRPVDVDDEI
jgi:hypothetical protein